MSEPTENQKNWDKFWKVMKLMPLWFVMPFTAFAKMQEVLAGKTAKDDVEDDLAEREWLAARAKAKADKKASKT